METSTARELTPDDHRTGFLRSLPRKIVEIKATFGAMIADPRSTRMRDELRRRLHALHTLARSYELTSLTESVRACIDIVDASRTAPVFSRAHIDRLASHIAAFAACAETDAQGLVASSGDASSGAPRSDLPRFQPLRVSSVPSPPALRSQSGRGTIPDGAALAREIHTENTKPTVTHRTLPPGAVLRKSSPANARIGAAVHVLFVGNSSRASALHDVMSSEVELVVTRTAADAMQRAKESAPDVIVAEVEAPAEGVSLVASLKSDPLTEFFPVVLIAPPGESPEGVRERCADAADIAAHSADGQGLWDVLDRVLSGANPLIPVSSTDFGEVTLDELTRALQDELRRGIVGAASPRARGARIALGQGNEVLAATWEAIARIREVVERRSNGSVRFELPTAPRGLPGTQVLVPGHDEPSVDTSVVAGEDPLPGRTVLVVDDDPAVVKNFSDLLRDAGMHVTAQTNGLDALQTARRVRPDLVIADIVMPGLDGFALCRAIRRDVILRHTPVVLISWRDDLLVKMREMGAQAQGYVRKEVGGEAILARVRDALRLRTRILKQVAEVTDGEVRGRVERVGVVALLEAVARVRRDVRASVVDAGSETELHVRDGGLVSVTRTAQDGTLTRGEAALLPLLGLGSARFVVRAAAAPRESEAEAAAREGLLDVVARAARKIAALEESLTGKVLLEVVRVELDRDAAAAYARALPKTTRAVVDRIIEGEAPRDLVLRDGIAPADLEPLLMELARRGAVQRVLGARGEDLAALRMIAPEPALTSSPGAAHEQEARDGALSILTAGESSRPGSTNPNRTTAQYAPVPVHDAAEAPATGGAKKSDSLADAVMRELRDTVDDPSRRMRASHSDAGPATSSTEEPPAQTGEHERATREPDLPPLPELTEELSDLKTPATPLPENLIAQLKLPHDATRERPSSEARADDDPSKTRTLPPEMLDELMDVARDRLSLSDADIPSPRLSAPEPEVELGDALDEVVTDVIVDEDRKITQRRLAAAGKPPPPPPVAARQSGSGRFAKPFVPAAAGRPQRSTKLATHPLDALPGDEITTPSELLGRDDLPPRKSAEPAPPARRSTEAPEVATEAPAPADPSERETVRAPAALKPVSSSEETAPLPGSTRASVSQSREGSQSRPILLLLGVMGAFGGSYYGVRWLLSQPSRDAAPIVTVQEEDAPELVVPTPAPTATDAGLRADTSDAAPAVAPTPSTESVDAGGVEYRDPGPWLDGSTLPIGSGLLVVNAPRAGASAVEVQIDQRPAGSAPTQAVLSEGLHTVRFRAGIITSYQFATVRGSRAVVIAPPSDR